MPQGIRGIFLLKRNKKIGGECYVRILGLAKIYNRIIIRIHNISTISETE